MSEGADRPGGVLLVDKPEGPTSHDVVGWTRWALGVSQVGHCGTLDPLATGLLVLCVGAATRLVPYLTGVDKVYRARFGLGRSTTTDDREGELLAEAPVSAEQRAAAGSVLEGMCGALSLPPPAFSAVKVEGQRAHARARRGEALELAPRPMTLHAVAAIAVGEGAEGPWIEATCTVSKGTYVRSLSAELGRRLGVPTYLAALRRLACGPLRVDDPRAVGGLLVDRLPDVPGLPPKVRLRLPGDGDPRGAARTRLGAARIAPADALPFPVVDAGPDEARLGGLLHGRAAPPDALAAPPPVFAEGLGTASRVGVAFPGRALVVAALDGDRWRPERVIHTSETTSGEAGSA